MTAFSSPSSLPALTKRPAAARVCTRAPASSRRSYDVPTDQGSAGGGRGGRIIRPTAEGAGEGPYGGQPWPSFDYFWLLEFYPLATKCATAFVLGALGDLIAQWVEGGRKDWVPKSLRRVLALGCVGAILTAPMFHFLYLAMENIIPTSLGKRAVFLQLALDQFVFAPGFLVFFFPLLSFLEGSPSSEVPLKKQIWDATKLTWMVFPPFQLVSFAFLPASSRVLVISVVDLFFNVGLSVMAHRKQEH